MKLRPLSLSLLFSISGIMMTSPSIWGMDLTAAELKSGDAVVAYKNGMLEVSYEAKTVIELKTIRFNYTDPLKCELTEATANTLNLELTYPAGAQYRHHVEDEEPRVVELTISVEANGFRFYAAPKWGSQTTLVFNSLGDHFFGLSEPLQPDSQLSPDLTGARIKVEVNSEPDTIAENFASAFSAFYISSFGYGAFYDTMARGHYDFAINGLNRIHHDTGTLDWHLFFGDDGVAIHRAYFDLIGSPKKVPLWAMGPIGWRDDNKGGAPEILDDLDRLEALKIPLTAWWVDRPYSDGAVEWSEMNFGKTFENPEVWISEIREKHKLEFMTWVATAMFQDKRFPKSLDGILTYLDLSDAETVEMYQRELKEKQYRYGVRGHKMDRADEYFPYDEKWADQTPSVQKRNKYAYLYAKIHHDVLTEAWGEDHFNFARAAIHRTQPYLSAIWGGDPRTSWEGLRGNLANGIRAGFLGFPIWGSDVGGYLGEGYIPEDLFLRWAQIGLMSGMFEIKFDGSGGWGRDRMPWQYDEAFQENLRTVFEERMRLLPYFYSLANTSAETGVFMQPMAYRHFDDPRTYGIWDQFYVGEGILVAPVVTRGIEREVYLPEGTWHDFDDLSAIYKGKQTIVVEADLDTIPRYVRSNSLYLSGNLPVGNVQTWRKIDPALVIHGVPGASGEETEFVYVDPLDENAENKIKMSRKDDQVSVIASPLGYPVTVLLWMKAAPKKVNRSFDYDEASQLLTVVFDPGEAIALQVEL